MTEKSPEDLFEPDSLIYLSPDSENILTSLDKSKVYVIGGIVDGTVKKVSSVHFLSYLEVNSSPFEILHPTTI